MKLRTMLPLQPAYLLPLTLPLFANHVMPLIVCFVCVCFVNSSMVFEDPSKEEEGESTSDTGTEDDLEELDKETLILRLQAAREEKM